MHSPSWPIEIQSNAAAGGRAAASARSANVSSCRPMTVRSCPAARAASRTRKGKRPLPAMSPRRTLFVGEHFFGAARGPAQDDASRRGADEVHEVLHLGARERAVLLDLLQRPRRVELRLQEIAERALQLDDDILRETAAHEADA